MSRNLTDRQQNVYQFIREKILTRGYGPTVREIGEQMDIRSPNGVMCHLRALEKKGMIKRDANKSRAIELTSPGPGMRRPTSLPMAGRVAAGQCSLAWEQDETVDLSELFVREDRFALEVTGDSMIDAGIFDGDYIVAKAGTSVSKGDIVVVGIPGDEATVKTWTRSGDTVTLLPANSRLSPMEFHSSEVTVYGRVVTVMRKL